ncbi:hypothetical protein H3H36_15575 [Duganella sp. FT3S]|uniref:DUF4142 domain-containing protein n=1 Tax=Rugamonas fusca TaxID=2758568 RepID=A0A7W2EJ75_9BURK|nr:hypothetical protein [Rugamonas fusca]MBA5606777.1 hypothetical protein [Rugamonas fusca]
MKIRNSVQAVATALLIAASATASAGLGGLTSLIPGGPSGGPVDAEGFLKNAAVAETLMRTSLDQLAISLATKEEIAQIDALKKQAAEKTDAKEKGAVEQEVAKSEAALLNARDFDKVASNEVKKMDAKQKQKLAGAATNFVLAMLKDKELMSQSSGILSGLGSNPANLSKVGAIKDAAGSMKNQLEVAGALATKVPKLFAAVGVKNPPSKASDSPVEIAD